MLFQAHEIFEKIQDIDLTNLSAETIGQVGLYSLVVSQV